jgi:hypothetical protein
MNPNVLIVVALGIVLVILVAGLVNLFREGKNARNLSNRLMRYRVLAQAAVILIIMALLYFNSR